MELTFWRAACWRVRADFSAARPLERATTSWRTEFSVLSSLTLALTPARASRRDWVTLGPLADSDLKKEKHQFGALREGERDKFTHSAIETLCDARSINICTDLLASNVW